MKINRLNFSIILLEGRQPYNCCREYIFEVKNFGYPLNTEQLAQLERMGLLGSGQGFSIIKEWTEDFDAWNKYYCYKIERFEDSGD